MQNEQEYSKAIVQAANRQLVSLSFATSIKYYILTVSHKIAFDAALREPDDAFRISML